MSSRDVEAAGQVFDPAGIATLRTALKLACDAWELREPLTDMRRNELAASILDLAQAGFSDSARLARIAVDKIRLEALQAHTGGRNPNLAVDVSWALREAALR